MRGRKPTLSAIAAHFNRWVRRKSNRAGDQITRLSTRLSTPRVIMSSRLVTAVTEIPSRNQFRCTGCKYRFSVTAGTIMHRSHLPLRKWFLAIYLMGRENRLEYRTCVAGAIERGGQVRIERIPDAKKGTIQGFVERTVSPEAEAIYTDELRASIGVETDTRRYEPGTPTTSGWSAMSTRTAWRASGASSSGPSSAASPR